MIIHPLPYLSRDIFYSSSSFARRQQKLSSLPHPSAVSIFLKQLPLFFENFFYLASLIIAANASSSVNWESSSRLPASPAFANFILFSSSLFFIADETILKTLSKKASLFFIASFNSVCICCFRLFIFLC